MNTKRILTIVFFIILAVVAIFLKRCNSNSQVSKGSNSTTNTRSSNNGSEKFNRNVAKFYFTKHARCRMKCREITQREIKEILAEGTINYNKSDLNDPQGPTYALEGMTDDRQHVRVIFAPKQQHMSVVTVIDLDVEHQCNCD